jgi:hypothetical protein
VVLYAGLCLYAWLYYPKALYPAPTLVKPVTLPAGYREMALANGKGENESPRTVRAIAAPRRPHRPTVVWFHGNGELIDGLVGVAERFAAADIGFVAMEYRGYGRSAGEGKPSEPGLYSDALTLLDALETETRGPGEGIVLVGYSLGSGVAGEMASRGRGRALVLISPFTSMTDMASRLAPILPTRWLVAERFDTLSKAPKIAMPALVLHGAEDELVPFDMGYALARAIHGADFVSVPDGHHADMLHADDGMVLSRIVTFAEEHVK